MMTESEHQAELRGCLMGTMGTTIILMILLFALQSEIDKLKWEKSQNASPATVGTR